MEKVVRTLSEFEDEATRFAKTLSKQEKEATLVTLSGELGAGKTTFTKALARALTITETITSPTFVLEKRYSISEGAPFKQLIHIDAYRLDENDNLEILGLTELMKDSNVLIVLEWPEKIAGKLPSPTTAISFKVQENGTRTISYD